MKFDSLRKYAEIFEYQRDSRLDVFAHIEDRDHQIGECWSKTYQGYRIDLLIFDFDCMQPSCKFLISNYKMECVEISTDTETIAKDFLMTDCNTFIFV